MNRHAAFALVIEVRHCSGAIELDRRTIAECEAVADKENAGAGRSRGDTKSEDQAGDEN